MDPKNPTPEPKAPGPSRPGETPSRETRTSERPLTDNERHAGTESSENEKVRRSNLAGDQDVDDADSDDTGR